MKTEREIRNMRDDAMANVKATAGDPSRKELTQSLISWVSMLDWVLGESTIHETNCVEVFVDLMRQRRNRIAEMN